MPRSVWLHNPTILVATYYIDQQTQNPLQRSHSRVAHIVGAVLAADAVVLACSVECHTLGSCRVVRLGWSGVTHDWALTARCAHICASSSFVSTKDFSRPSCRSSVNVSAHSRQMPTPNRFVSSSISVLSLDDWARFY